MSNFINGRPDDHVGAPLGVLFTGYMEKKNPASIKGNQWEKRFLVLTYEAFYWFRRKENYELFGEERGHIYLKDILSVRALHDDDHQFEITDKTKNSRYFRPVLGIMDDQHSNEKTEEWITAIRSAMKHIKEAALKESEAEAKSGASKSRKYRKKASITMKKFLDPQDEEERRAKASQVKAQMLSVKTSGVEVVIARNPEWQDIITLPEMDYHDDDEFIVSTSNGGIVKVSKRLLEDKCTVLSNSNDYDEDDEVTSNPAASPSSRRKSRRSSASEKYKDRLKGTLARGFMELTNTDSNNSEDIAVKEQDSGSVVAGPAGGATAVEALLRQHDGVAEVSNNCFSLRVEGVPLPCSVYMFAFRDATLDYLEDRKDDRSATSSLLGGIKSSVLDTLKGNKGFLNTVIAPALLMSYLTAVFKLLKSFPTTDLTELMHESFTLASPPLWLTYSLILLGMSILYPKFFFSIEKHSGARGRDRSRTISVDLIPKSGLTYRLVLLGYSFTSEDNPVEHKDHELPARFATCEPTLAACRRRYDLTRHWRETEGINKILQDPQPYFHYMKFYYPHYNAGRGRDGHVVAYTRPGELNLKGLHDMGFDNDLLLRHWLFDKEYQWEVLCKGDDDARGIDVIDVKNVSLWDLMGSTLDFVKKTMAIGGNHYPNRAHRVFIVNASSTFTRIYGMLKAFIPKNTLERLKLIGEKQSDILEALQEDIDLDQIPDYYGGGLSYDGYAGPNGNDSCRFSSPETVGMCVHVHSIPEATFDGFDHCAYASVEEFNIDKRQGRLRGYASHSDSYRPAEGKRGNGINAEARQSNIKAPSPQVQSFLQREASKRNSKLKPDTLELYSAGSRTPRDNDDRYSDVNTSPDSQVSYGSPQRKTSLFQDSPAPTRKQMSSPRRSAFR